MLFSDSDNPTVLHCQAENCTKKFVHPRLQKDVASQPASSRVPSPSPFSIEDTRRLDVGGRSSDSHQGRASIVDARPPPQSDSEQKKGKGVGDQPREAPKTPDSESQPWLASKPKHVSKSDHSRSPRGSNAPEPGDWSDPHSGGGWNNSW